jgi:hypothetical protein
MLSIAEVGGSNPEKDQGWSRCKLSKPIRLVVGLVQPLTDAWCLHVFPLGYASSYEHRVCTFMQLEWGLLVLLYKIGT